MPRDDAPQAIYDLADARAGARRAREWDTADRLRGEIEAAGWIVIDAGTMYSLERAAAADVVDGGRVRYGSSRSVPSRLADAPVGIATIVLVAGGQPDDPAGTIRALVGAVPEGTGLVVVANAPPVAHAESLEALATAPGGAGAACEIVWTSERLGHAAALNAGIRRAGAPVVILVEPGIEPAGDLASPLVAALADPTVAVAGPFGLRTRDLRSFQPAPQGDVDVEAIEGSVLAFQRADYVARGPLDEHFETGASLDVWWSLVLRDQGEDDGEDAAPRRAVQVAGVPVARPPAGDQGSTPAAAPGDTRDRLAKRSFYRVLKRFATRRDLLVEDGGGT